MSKKSQNEEKAVSATKGEQGGGMSNEKLAKYAKSYENLKAKMDEVRGDLGAEIKSFEEDGGHKRALKVALAIKKMDSGKAQDFWRSLEYYMDVLGIFDQHDLFDPVPGQEAMPAAPKLPASAVAN